MEEKEKSIDEAWKQTADKEKANLKEKGEFVAPDPDFNFFISTLGLQASIALGIIPNPSNNQKEENPQQAKFLIDTIAVLKEKTKGNLNKEESDLIENILYELRMQYISKEDKKSPGGIIQ